MNLKGNDRYKLSIIFVGIYLSLLLIVLVFSMFGSHSKTYAWFSKATDVPFEETTSAVYDIDTIIKKDDIEVEKTDNGFFLEAGQEYSVYLKARGDSANGYCIISYGDERLYTDKINVGEEFIFNFIPRESSYYNFYGQWGIRSDYQISNNSLFT